MPAVAARVEARARQGGFSLLEVIVALGILTLGVSSAMALFAAATAAHKRALDRVHAAAIAEQVIADVEMMLERGEDPEAIEEDPPLTAVEKNWPGFLVGIKFYTVQAPGADDLLLLEVRIYWRYRGVDREERFQQLVTRTMRIR